MKDLLIKVIGVVGIVFISLCVLADFTPFTSSPEYVSIGNGETCEKQDGALKCRWGGDCEKVGNSCASCTDGYQYSPAMQTCYDCPEGTDLQNVDGKFVCR